MTRKQKQRRCQGMPRQTPAQQAARERYLLAELARLGYRVQSVGTWQYFISKEAA